MPAAIANTNLSKSQGHCWPPTWPTLGSSDVRVGNGVSLWGVVRVGDPYATHPGYCGKIPPHSSGALTGSPDVFANGIPVHRVGDYLFCFDIAAQSASPSVVVNGKPGKYSGPGGVLAPVFNFPGEVTIDDVNYPGYGR